MNEKVKWSKKKTINETTKLSSKTTNVKYLWIIRDDGYTEYTDWYKSVYSLYYLCTFYSALCIWWGPFGVFRNGNVFCLFGARSRGRELLAFFCVWVIRERTHTQHERSSVFVYWADGVRVYSAVVPSFSDLFDRHRPISSYFQYEKVLKSQLDVKIGITNYDKTDNFCRVL